MAFKRKKLSGSYFALIALSWRCCANRAVRAHNTRRKQAVDREAVLAADPPFTSSERESGNSRLRYHATRYDKAERLRLAISVPPQRSTLHARDPGVWVHIDAAHPRQVDDHAPRNARVAGD